ncbi:MAG: gliding motility-associated C-terminal domain-containing protein [Lewinellaceae bacterium]|nr:gliding motility-associated C-terminal domain-containing protein [Lewinellaceae bacterium]
MTDGCGHAAGDQVSVTAVGIPSASISGSGTICAEGATGPVDLTISFTGSPLWAFVYSVNGVAQPPITTSDNPYTLTINSPGTYSLQSVVSTLGNCPGTVTGTVDITETTITPGLQTTAPTCFGTSDGAIATTVPGGADPLTFNWSNGSSDQNIDGLPAGTYTLTVSDSNGCEGTVTVSLNEPPELTASVANVQQIDCIHPTGSIFLSVSGGTPGYSYQWSPSGSGPNPAGLQEGTYTATITDDNGCSDSVSAILNSDLSPPLAMVASNNILGCMVSEVTLSGSGSSTGPNIAYQWGGPGILSGGTTLNPVVNQPGLYTLTVINTQNGCIETATVTVEQDITPPVAVGVSLPITCTDTVVMINGSGSSQGPNFTYQWNGPGIQSGASSLNPEVNVSGTYSLTVTNADNGCTASTNVVVGDQTQPPVAMGTSTPITCANPWAIIDGSGSSAGPNFSYLWTTTDGNIVSGATTMNPTVDLPGAYTLIVTNTLNGCISSATVQVEVDENVPVSNSGPDMEITCDESVITLDGTGSSSGPFSFLWTTADGNILSGEMTLTPHVNLPGEYVLSVTSLINGCVSTSSVEVTENLQLPDIDIHPPQEVNCSHPEITVDATNSTNQGDLSFTWTTPDGNILSGQGTLSIVVDQGGIYVLSIVNNQNGCLNTGSVSVSENLYLPELVIALPDTVTCISPQVVIDASASGQGPDFSYTWTTPNGNILSGENSLFPEVDAPGDYILTVLNTFNGCSSSAEVTVEQNVEYPQVDAGPGGELTCQLTTIELQGEVNGQTIQFVIDWTTETGNILNGAFTLTPEVDEPGSYILTVTDSLNGCFAVDTVEITQDANVPEAIVSPSNPFNCYFSTVTLDGTASTQGPNQVYTWSSPDGNFEGGIESLMPVVDLPGTYVLTISDTVNLCIANDTIHILPDTLTPELTVTDPELLTCYVPETALEAFANGLSNITVQWSTLDGNITGDDQGLVSSADQAGNYWLVVTNNENGCSTTTQVEVHSDLEEPLADAGPEGVINCQDTLLILNGSGEGGGDPLLFAWTTLDGLILSGEGTPHPVVGSEGIYMLTVTNQTNGCIAVSEVEITEDLDIPISDPGPGGVLNCYFPQIQLNGSNSSIGPFISYQWTTTGGNFLSGTDTPNPVVDGAGNYLLTVTNEVNHCIAQNEVLISEDVELPDAEAGLGNTLTCSQSSVVLSGEASQGSIFEYTWSTANGNIVSGETILNPLVNAGGLYELLVFNTENGCSSTDEVWIEDGISYPMATTIEVAPITCLDPIVELDGTGSDTGPNFVFEWTTSGGNILSGENTLNPQVDQPGGYQLEVTNIDNDCSSIAEVVVLIDTIAPQVDAGPDLVFPCMEDIVYLQGSAIAGTGNLSNQWTTINGQILSGNQTLHPAITSAGLYQLAVTNTDNGCSAFDEVEVTGNTPVNMEYQFDQPPCFGDRGSIQILDVEGGMPPYLYSIDGGATFQSSTVFTDLGEGTYSIVVQDALGCETVPEIQFIHLPEPIVIDLGLDVTLKLGESYQLQALINIPESEIGQIGWTPVAGLSCTDCLAPLVTPLTTTLYRIDVFTDNGCQSSAAIRVAVDKRPAIYVPNLFSPNGDGENDLLYIFAKDKTVKKINSFMIFDRWGESVFEYYGFEPNNPAYGWDGSHRGIPMPPAVFVWFAEIEFNDGHTEIFEGDVTLVR